MGMTNEQKVTGTPVFDAVWAELGIQVKETGAAYAREMEKGGVPLDKLGHHAKRKLRKETTAVLVREGFVDG